ncbi:hypothetical protein AA101099_2167 [Neoasaia chiangmaiensis NBRC 101099]|nr:hypothetical protein AA101099_2167 [Neoasaia chiangmaiensis NBRC 101099]GEN13845.1 hypothetical protein NCH01_02760 [Neoasaia chiangmaiensis]
MVEQPGIGLIDAIDNGHMLDLNVKSHFPHLFFAISAASLPNDRCGRTYGAWTADEGSGLDCAGFCNAET